MVIDGRVVYVYDIEIFPNCFHCTVKNTETKDYLFFEISDRKNNLLELVEFFTSNLKHKLICGYNCIHYDNPVINYIIEFSEKMYYMPIYKICNSLYNFSNIIINSDNPAKWRRWKYATKFKTLDLLTMLFSQALRVGLKEMEVTMQFRNVQEYEGDFNEYIKDSEIPNMIKYNINDVDATEELLYRCESAIKLRLDIEKEFGVDVLSKDGMTIGNEILKLKYLEKTGKSWDEIKDLRSPCSFIDLNKVILPFIKYKTPLLQEFLEEFKQQIVSPGRDGYNKHFLLDDLEYSVGVGGIHSINKPEKIIPAEDEVLLDSDVNSLYPSLLIKYEFIPRHLGKEFLEIYSQIREDRLYAKRNKLQTKNETYKLALNGATGNFQNEYSWMYDPFAVMQIRINGQLLLLMLAEDIINAGGKIKQANTDGLLYTFKKSKLDELNNILKNWESLTGLTLETDEFECFYQSAVNDYVGALKGYSENKNPKLLKKKGLFIDEVILGKGMSPKIIPKAAINFLVNGIPVEQTIKNCKNLNDFITYQKVSKQFSVEYNGELINRINRYYCSTKGNYLYKCKVDENKKRTGYINMLKDSPVVIVNNLEEIKNFPKDINYNYYIKEVNKIIFPFRCKQMTLFDYL